MVAPWSISTSYPSHCRQSLSEAPWYPGSPPHPESPWFSDTFPVAAFSPILEHFLVLPLFCFLLISPPPSPVSFFPYCILKEGKSKHTRFLASFFFILLPPAPGTQCRVRRTPVEGVAVPGAGGVLCGPAVTHCAQARPTCSHFTLLPVLWEFLTKQQMPISVG